MSHQSLLDDVETLLAAYEEKRVKLTAWEIDYLESLQEHLSTNKIASLRQAEVVEQIMRKMK